MKPEQWRPSAALRKRRTAFFTMIELSGLASLMVFFLVLLMLPPFFRYPYGHGVDLAPTDHPKAMPGALREDALQITVTRDGLVFLTGRRVRPNDLIPLLKEGVREGSERKVYLKADARARYADVNAVLDHIRLAGIENVALLTVQSDHNPAH